MTLADLNTGEEGIITKIKGRGAFRKRIIEMGFVKGQKIHVIKNAPLKAPIEYQVMGYRVSLRRTEASLIEVVSQEEIKKDTINKNKSAIIDEARLKVSAYEKGKTINIALVGNPNCGKTTLFNHVSKSRERVGNYTGVTIELKTAQFRQHDYTFNITDLPGTYSLTAYNPEELFVRQFILEKKPDIVINVVDSTNLERNLYLTTQLIDMDIKVIVALNMYDELEKNKNHFDHDQLGQMLGIPFIPTVCSRGKGIESLMDKAIEVYEDYDETVRHIHIDYGTIVEPAIKEIQDFIKKDPQFKEGISPRYLAIKLLEKDQITQRSFTKYERHAELMQLKEQKIEQIENSLKEDSETLITDIRYGFITGALKETYEKPIGSIQQQKTRKIDHFLTHKYLGYPIFILIMWAMFITTFKLGSYPMEWINTLFSVISNWSNQLLPDGMFKDMIIEGLLEGVGGVAIFLPNIIILFFFISLMEDTGYMARVAFIMDKLMHKIGLHGQSFIPLLMGFGCNVPAIMATRSIKNKNNRLLTMLINPFMSCSARLPVYVLFISAFFPKHPGTILFSIYLFGILMAFLMAIVLKNTLFKSNETPFVMELPPYRMPTIKTIVKHMWYRASIYIKKIGGIILIASIIIWALGYFPQNVHFEKNYNQIISNIQTKYEKLAQEIPKSDKETMQTLNAQKTKEINQVLLAKRAEKQEKSLIGHIGQTIEPVIRPLGFDWRMGIGILSGIAAKEITVSTLAVLFQAEEREGNNSYDNLIFMLQTEKYQSGPREGEKILTPLVALSFMLFMLLYFPCIGVIAVIKKESGSWKWALFTIIYTTGLAWVVSFAIYQTGQLLLYPY